jgi:uncharacterized protein YcnI
VDLYRGPILSGRRFRRAWFTAGVRAISLAIVGAAIMGMAVMVSAPAWAHVRVVADNAAAGQHSILTFSVPNESDNASPTTQLSISLPNLTSVSVEAMPGWTVHLDRNLHTGTVGNITWTAAPGGGIGPDQFSEFRVAVKLPDAATVSFPATQTYADGTVVRWDEPTLPGGKEPEHPAPMLTLTTGQQHGDQDFHGPMPTVSAAPKPAPAAAPAADSVARWLAGAAMGVAVLAAGLTFVLVRRQR